jgi:hypothetical protein
VNVVSQALELLWLVIQDSTPVEVQIAQQAADQMEKLLLRKICAGNFIEVHFVLPPSHHNAGFADLRVNYLKRCVANLRAGQSVPQSLRLASGILHIFKDNVQVCSFWFHYTVGLELTLLFACRRQVSSPGGL